MAATIIDPAIWEAYQLGVVLGVVILTTLMLFPGSQSTKAKSASCQSTRHGQNVKPREPIPAEENATNAAVSPAAFSEKRAKSLKQKSRHYQDTYWTPHRTLNTAVYAVILTVAAIVLVQSYSNPAADSYTSNNDQGSLAPGFAPSMARHPLVLWFRAYFPKETSVLLGTKPPKQGSISAE
jgi:cell division protein FtsN